MDEQNYQTDSRWRVLEAAADEFAESGFAGARVDRIASRADINKAMIYYHFSSKQKLYQAVFTTQVEKIGAALSDMADTGADLEPALLKISQLYHAIAGRDSRFARILLHELADGGTILRQALETTLFQRGIPARLKERFNEARLAGRLRDVDSRNAIISFIGMNLFYLIMAPIANSMWEIEDAKEFVGERPAHIVDLFMRGIEAR